VSQVQKSKDLSNDEFSASGSLTKRVDVSLDFHTTDIWQTLGWSVSGEETLEVVILILGRTNISGDSLEARLSQLFDRGLAPALAKKRALIIDRTADGGVVKVLSSALRDRVVSRTTFLLRIVSSHENPASAQVDEDQLFNTTRFVTVKGKNLDDEINKTYEVIQELSKGIPMLTILVNGSPTAECEVVKCVRRASQIFIIEGSGDLADTIQQAWQNKQKHIADLSRWDAEGPNGPQPTPPFVADMLLADILAEGDLRFFAITDEPERLERTIDVRLNYETILAQAQAQRQMYSEDANRQKTLFERQQLWILFLGVFITVLAAFQAFSQQMRWDVPLMSLGSIKLGLEDLLTYVLIALPVGLTLLIAGANHSKHAEKWVTMRAISETFKQEMFRYRTRTGSYSDIQIFRGKTARENMLANRLQAITTQWLENNLDYALFPAPNQSFAKQSTGALSLYLPPSGYITERLDNQLNFYTKNSQELGRKLTRIRWWILIVGALAALLAALHLVLVIIVTIAVAGALTTYLEYNQVANTLKQYNQAALSLINIKNWWVALGTDQADQKNIDKLVDLVEITLQTESSGWVQQLQSALARLHTQQAKQDENSLTNQERKKEPNDQQTLATAPDGNVIQAANLEDNGGVAPKSGLYI
jgi:SLOG in TRPM, prokaryote/SMODS and SLOG-associating 2TM effector domain 1/Protein of unknown function (DUF4231)